MRNLLAALGFGFGLLYLGASLVSSQTINAPACTISGQVITCGSTALTVPATPVSGANGGTGVANTAKTITLGASVTTTGAGAPTLAFSGTGRTFTYPDASTTLLSTAGAILAPTTVVNPVATNNMQGLGGACKLTPLYSSRVVFVFTGSLYNATAAQSAIGTMYYGTGTAPVNGAATTGTNTNVALTNGSGLVANLGYTWLAAITGLTPTTAYWFDLNGSGSGGTTTFTTVTCSAWET